MKSVAIIGGETHIAEITKLAGEKLSIVGAAVREDQITWAEETFDCPAVTDFRDLIRTHKPDIVAVANENNRHAEAILAAIEAGCDVIVDKPVSITVDHQREIEEALEKAPDRRLLNLLTLRGVPHWKAVQDIVQAGTIGTPAFVHVRMAVRLKRDQRPPWFLDVRASGGLFLDLLIHGIDQVEWITGRRIVALTARTGNLSAPSDVHLRDHASVYCELDNGATAVVEGQRMLPDTKGSDYRIHAAGTLGYLDMAHPAAEIYVTHPDAADEQYTALPKEVSVVEDWIEGGNLVPQEVSLRANMLSLLATESAGRQERIEVP